MSRTVTEGQIDNVRMEEASWKGSFPKDHGTDQFQDRVAKDNARPLLGAGSVDAKARAVDRITATVGRLWLMVRLV